MLLYSALPFRSDSPRPRRAFLSASPCVIHCIGIPVHMAWQTAFALFASLFPSPGVPLVSGACYWYHFPPPSSPLALGHMISSFHCCPAARMLCPAPLYSWGPWHGPGLFVLCKPILPVLPSRAICYTPAARRVIYTQPLGPPPSAPHPSPFTACRPHRPFPPGSASRCLGVSPPNLAAAWLVPALCGGMMIGAQSRSVCCVLPVLCSSLQRAVALCTTHPPCVACAPTPDT
jgi:hypothetical protein